MIRRLRNKHSSKMLAELYPVPHDHKGWGHGHHLRVEFSKTLAKWIFDWKDLKSVGDLSCGNAAIAEATGAPKMILGDFASGYEYEGPLEITLAKTPPMDLYVCCETLEHLDDPSSVLSTIREKAQFLLLSTPINAWLDANKEHYWAWDAAGVENLLSESGWKVEMFASLNSTRLGETYEYGFWVAS